MMTPEDRQRELKRRKAVRRALEGLERDGRLSAEEVVAFARDPSNVLHGEFEWDDVVAGHRYRLDQARRLIRTIIDVRNDDAREVAVVRYVRDPQMPPDRQGYVTVDQARSEPETAAAIVAYEVGRAESILRRAEDLADVLGMRQEVAAARKRLTALQTKARKATPK